MWKNTVWKRNADEAGHQCNTLTKLHRTFGISISALRTIGPSALRTIGPSDYRPFGLSVLRTIDPSDYRPLDYRPFGLSDLRTIGPSECNRQFMYNLFVVERSSYLSLDIKQSICIFEGNQITTVSLKFILNKLRVSFKLCWGFFL